MISYLRCVRHCQCVHVPSHSTTDEQEQEEKRIDMCSKCKRITRGLTPPISCPRAGARRTHDQWQKAGEKSCKAGQRDAVHDIGIVRCAAGFGTFETVTL